MKILLKRISVISLLLSLMSCGKIVQVQLEEVSAENKNPYFIQNLKDKTADEVLEIKYNKANLNCNLWLQFGKELNRDLKANDSFSLDLLKTDINRESKHELIGKVKNQTLEVVINLIELKIKTMKIEDLNNNTTYTFKNSPVVEMNFDYRSNFDNGKTIFKGSGIHKRSINEKIKLVTLNHSRRAGNDSKSYFEYLECTIDTDIKAGYQDQFSLE